MSRTSLCLLMLFCTVVIAPPVHADNWPQWRGPGGDGVVQETDLPITWGKESGVEWKRKLPGWGNSTPAIWGDAVFVTSQLEDGRLVLLRIDKASGDVEWTQRVGAGVPRVPTSGRKSPDMRRYQEFHREQNMATPSPVTDGRVVVAHFGNGDLAAYDFDGRQLWYRNLQKDHGDYTIWWGHANSPVLSGELVISVCMQDSCIDLPGKPSPSYLVAHDKLSGDERWKTMRMTDATREHCDAYTTPFLRRAAGDRQELVVMGGQVLDAYDPSSGKRLWRLPGLDGNRLIPSPVAAHGMIYASQGMREAMLAVKVDGPGSRSRDDVVWRYEKGISDSPSPVVWRDLIYFVNNSGIARCLDAHGGGVLWVKRLAGQYRASPIAADGRIYFLNTDGLTTVVSASPEFKRLAENQLDDEETIASPAISDGRIFIRGRKWLSSISLGEARAEPAEGLRVSVGLRKQLLVDDYIIAKKEGVTRELGKVEKHGVVLEPELPTDFIPPAGERGSEDYERNLGSGRKPDGSRVALDFGFYTTVLWNEKDQKFQMWYMPWRLAGVGYAESRDGIHWTRPLVGKSGRDNIVHLSQSFSCTIDPTVPWGHAEKFKAAFDSNTDRVCQPGLAHSADGIHWTDYNDGKPVTGRAADFFDQILWDPIMEKYRLTCRTDIGGTGGSREYRSVRVMVHDGGNDLKNHPTAWKTIADRIVVDDPKREKNPWGNPRLQFNWMTCWIHEGVYFAPMNVYTMDESHFFEGFDYQTRHEEDVLDFYIGTSRDGASFDKSWIHARRPLVPRGPDGSFDKDGVFPASQFLTHEDEHWIYYGGASERHYSIGRDMKIGLARLRLDGFICLEAGERPGVVTTKPFRLEGRALEVNVDARSGRIQVEMLDEAGVELPGFSGKSAPVYKSADDLRLKLSWSRGRDLSTLEGRVVRIRFRLRNARLYTFQVQ